MLHHVFYKIIFQRAQREQRTRRIMSRDGVLGVDGVPITPLLPLLAVRVVSQHLLARHVVLELEAPTRRGLGELVVLPLARGVGVDLKTA